jgi:hypothetical protein
VLGSIFNLATNFIHTALTPASPSGYVPPTPSSVWSTSTSAKRSAPLLPPAFRPARKQATG